MPLNLSEDSPRSNLQPHFKKLDTTNFDFLFKNVFMFFQEGTLFGLPFWRLQLSHLRKTSGGLCSILSALLRSHVFANYLQKSHLYTK